MSHQDPSSLQWLCLTASSAWALLQESLVLCNSVWSPIVAKANPGFLLLWQGPHLVCHPISILPFGGRRQFVARCSDDILEEGPDGFHTR